MSLHKVFLTCEYLRIHSIFFIIQVAHSLASKSMQLKIDFIQALEKKITTETDVEKQAMDNVYNEMLQKLTNTRIQEFISSLKQKMALRKGQTSTDGQNLSDQLLTHHMNNHSLANTI